MARKKLVLVVDDEADIRDGLNYWLDSEGYETVNAVDGDSGMESALARTPDAILMDVMMPGKSGINILTELRADQGTTGIPVIMLSASLRDEQRALDAGASYFVHKPFEGGKLIATVKKVMDRDCAVK